MFIVPRRILAETFTIRASAQRSMAGAGTQSGLKGAHSRAIPTRGRATLQKEPLGAYPRKCLFIYVMCLSPVFCQGDRR
jgi:hypothetical protein